MRDKVKAMLGAVVIGDVLGLPYESCYEDYGYITEYECANPHLRASDDSQLTITIAESLINAGDLDINHQIDSHIKAYKNSTYGWGSTTRYAIAKLIDPDTPKPNKQLGSGNGIAMKFAPVGAWLTVQEHKFQQFSKIAELAMLTHPTSLGIGSGFATVFAIEYCLITKKFDPDDFIRVICAGSDFGKHYIADDLPELRERFEKIKDVEDIKGEFGKGSPYVYNSLPFAYAYFIRNPHDIRALYDVVSAGGDADTNASIVGALLGALNGPDIFPKHLLGLKTLDMVDSLADKFCDKFNI